MTLRTSLQMPWRRPTNSGIEVNGVKQLLLLDVLAFRVRDVNRAWPNKHGLAPVGEGRNVGRKFSDHGLDAGYRAEFHESSRSCLRNDHWYQKLVWSYPEVPPCHQDHVRQAKADFPLVLLVPG